MVVLKRVSVLTGVTNIRAIDVDLEKLIYWEENRGSVLIQNYFPELSAEDREFLLTGSTPEEWGAIFGDEREAA